MADATHGQGRALPRLRRRRRHQAGMSDPVRAPVAFVDEGLGNSSYLIGLGDGRALALDPSRDPAPYLREAERRGWRAEGSDVG